MRAKEHQQTTTPPQQHPPATGAAPAEVMELARECFLLALADPPVGRSTPPGLRATLERLCDQAHTEGLRAEQVILRLKAAWWDLPEVRQIPCDYEGLVLSRVITLCIEEYFAPGAGEARVTWRRGQGPRPPYGLG